MPYDVDPDLITYAMSMNAPPRTLAARDDWRTLREQAEAGLSLLDASLPEHPEVARVDRTAIASDGTELLVRWYDPSPDREPGPAAVFLHGGGMVLGSVATYDRLVAGYVAASGVPFLSVDYRVAPEHPHPTPVEDCFAGLQWLVDHADELGVDPAASPSWATARAAGSRQAWRSSRATGALRWRDRSSCTRCSTTARPHPIPSWLRTRRGPTTTTTPGGTPCSVPRSEDPTSRTPQHPPRDRPVRTPDDVHRHRRARHLPP